MAYAATKNLNFFYKQYFTCSLLSASLYISLQFHANLPTVPSVLKLENT